MVQRFEMAEYSKLISILSIKHTLGSKRYLPTKVLGSCTVAIRVPIRLLNIIQFYVKTLHWNVFDLIHCTILIASSLKIEVDVLVWHHK